MVLNEGTGSLGDGPLPYWFQRADRLLKAKKGGAGCTLGPEDLVCSPRDYSQALKGN